MTCKWCGKQIPKVIDGKSSTQRYWHPACKYEWELHADLGEQFRFIVKRDGERCRLCGGNPSRWHRGEVMTVVDWSRGTRDVDFLRELWWADPAVMGYAFRDIHDPNYVRHPDMLMLGMRQDITRVTALQVDHRIPLWMVRDLPDAERRWYYGPGNLWLLCDACHKIKNASEARMRALARRRGPIQLELL